MENVTVFGGRAFPSVLVPSLLHVRFELTSGDHISRSLYMFSLPVIAIITCTLLLRLDLTSSRKPYLTFQVCQVGAPPV